MALSNPVSGVISAGIGAIGSAASAAASKYAADKSYQAQIETNEMNYKINQENNSANAAMVDKQNEYNAAVNQRLRLEAAGMNPYMMMNGGSAGASNVSVDGTQKPVHLDAPKLDYSNFANQIAASVPQALDTFAKGGTLMTQLKQADANLAETKQRIKNGEVRQRLDNAQASNQEFQYELSNILKPTTIATAQNQLELLNKQIDNQFQDYVSKWLTNAKLPRMLDAQIAKDVSQSLLYNAQIWQIGKMTPAQVNNLVADTVQKYASARNLDVNTHNAEILLPWQVKSLQASVNQMNSQSRFLDVQAEYIPKNYNLGEATLQQRWYEAKTNRERLKYDKKFETARKFQMYGGTAANILNGVGSLANGASNLVGTVMTGGVANVAGQAAQGMRGGSSFGTSLHPASGYNQYYY